MVRVFVSGSSTGLGLLAARQLVAEGHDVIFHARNAKRATDLKKEVGTSTSIVIGDISTISGALDIAHQVNAIGAIDSVIHNAGVGYGSSPRQTPDGFPDIFAVNVLAPYILTSRIVGPSRLVYLSSSMHRTSPDVGDIFWQARRWNGSLAYSESKLYVTALAFLVARLRPTVCANAVDPGWVPTRMGGQGAPDDLQEGCATQAALAAPKDQRYATLTGAYLHHMRAETPATLTQTVSFQDQLLEVCRKHSGVDL